MLHSNIVCNCLRGGLLWGHIIRGTVFAVAGGFHFREVTHLVAEPVHIIQGIVFAAAEGFISEDSVRGARRFVDTFLG